MAKESSKAGKINVFNSTTRQRSIGVRRHSHEAGARGPAVMRVRLLPGNNKIDAELWAICKEQKVVQNYLSEVDRIDFTGRVYPSKILVENYVDPKLKSTTSNLGQRITDTVRARHA